MWINGRRDKRNGQNIDIPTNGESRQKIFTCHFGPHQVANEAVALLVHAMQNMYAPHKFDSIIATKLNGPLAVDITYTRGDRHD